MIQFSISIQANLIHDTAWVSKYGSRSAEALRDEEEEETEEEEESFST